MADKEISTLPKATHITEDSLLAVFVPGALSPAQSVTGKQFADFARDSITIEVDKASGFADSAERYASNALSSMNGAAQFAENSEKSAIVSESEANRSKNEADRASSSAQSAHESAVSSGQSKADAENAAERAGLEADRASSKSNEAEEWADKAQREADRAAASAVPGVYNIILRDEDSGIAYALNMEDGILCGIQTDADVEPTELQFVDTQTGAVFILGVENAQFYVEEI